jgi:Arc-like DNA binding domain
MARKSEVVGLRLRMPAGVHRLLVASAQRNNRSLNSEILWGLAQYLGGDAQKQVEHMAVEQRRQIHNVLRALIADPEKAAQAIANFDKGMEEK